MRPPRSWPRSLAWSVGLVLAPVLIGRLVPGLPQGWMNNLTLALVFATAAMGLNVAMGYAGQISLGHAAFYGAGAFAGALITGRLYLPFLLGVLVAALVGAAFAFVIGLISLRIGGLHLAISTLAFGLAMFDSAFKTEFLTGASAGTPAPRPVAGDFEFILNSDYAGLVVALALLVWHLDRNAVRTKLGRAFNAIREDEDMAATLGVDVTRYKVAAFVLAGAFTGIAGAAYAPLLSLVQDRTFNFDTSLLFVIVLVVGGLGSRVGVFTAGMAFVIFPFIVGRFDALSDVQFLIGALLLLFTLVRHPGGIAQALVEARERKEAKERIIEDTQHDAPVMASLPAPRGGDGGSVTDPILRITDLSVRFGGLQALDAASFDVPTGKIVGLIGPNGAGKTTCFNAISGLVRPTGGRIEFNGTDITQMPVHERASLGMGRTFQLLGLAKSLTVMENLLLAQHRLASYPGPASLVYPPAVARTETELRDAAGEALATLGFERFADTPLRNLSHGQQRLVELAASLITAPDILLLDEPSGGMAPNAAESLAARLREIRDELGRTVLLIEHHIPLVLAVCDVVHVLSAGMILASGTPDEVARNPAVVEAYLGTKTARRVTGSHEPEPSGAKTRVKAKPKAKSRAKASTKSQPKPKAKAKPKSKPKAKAKVKPDTTRQPRKRS